MTIDFFVHPEFDGGISCSMKEYGNYISALLKILEKNKYSILVTTSSGDKTFREKIPRTRQIVSGSCLYKGNIHAVGEITDSHEWNKLTELIAHNKSDRMIIHGSYYGLCPEGFGLQLFGYLNYNEQWFKDSSDDSDVELAKEHEKLGSFLDSKIKYGIVLYPGKSIGNNLLFKNIIKEKCRKLPAGNIAFQLTDSGTKIFGRPKKL